VPGGALLAAGMVSVTVVSPGPGGGTSNGLWFEIRNPEPRLESMKPVTATVGSPGFTLTVTGTGFVEESLVYWDSTALSTGFVSGSNLTATVPGEALLAAGTVSVTVVNPAPGGGTSTSLPFEIVEVSWDFYAYLPFIARNSTAAASASDVKTHRGLTEVGTDPVDGTLVWTDGGSSVTGHVRGPRLPANVTEPSPAPRGGRAGHVVFRVAGEPDDFYAYLPLASRESVSVIRVRPSYSSVRAGDSVTVEVWLEEAVGYYGLEFMLEFDSEVIMVPAGKVSPLWEVFDAASHLVGKNEVDNEAGVAWYAVSNAEPAEEFTGTGRVCSITFEGVGPGSVVLDFSDASPPKGGSREGEPLYPVAIGGQEIVVLE
jgi:hypothetical protein